MKRINSELSKKIASRAEHPRQENEEQHIVGETDCARKMVEVYEKEIVALKAKVKVNTAPEKIVELQRKCLDMHKGHEESLKRIKELDKKVKDMDKAFKKHQESNEEALIKAEVICFGVVEANTTEGHKQGNREEGELRAND